MDVVTCILNIVQTEREVMKRVIASLSLIVFFVCAQQEIVLPEILLTVPIKMLTKCEVDRIKNKLIYYYEKLHLQEIPCSYFVVKKMNNYTNRLVDAIDFISPQSEELLYYNLKALRNREPFLQNPVYDKQKEIDNCEKIVAQWHPAFQQLWQKYKNKMKEFKGQREPFCSKKQKPLLQLVHYWYAWSGNSLLNINDDQYKKYRDTLEQSIDILCHTISPQSKYTLARLFNTWLKGKKISPDFKIVEQNEIHNKKTLIKKFPASFDFKQWCLKNYTHDEVSQLIYVLYKTLNINILKENWDAHYKLYIAHNVKQAIDSAMESLQRYLSPQSTIHLIKDFCRVCKGKLITVNKKYNAKIEEARCQKLLAFLPEYTVCKVYCNRPEIRYKVAEILYGYLYPSTKNIYAQPFSEHSIKQQLQTIEDFLIGELLYGNAISAYYQRKGYSNSTQFLAHIVYMHLDSEVQKANEQKNQKDNFKKIQKNIHFYSQKSLEQERAAKTALKRATQKELIVKVPVADAIETRVLWPLSYKEQCV